MANRRRRKDGEDQDDDYWNTTKLKANISKAGGFNMFDDDVTFDTAKDFALSFKVSAQDDDDDLETINWDDTPVQTNATQSVRYRPPPPTAGSSRGNGRDSGPQKSSSLPRGVQPSFSSGSLHGGAQPKPLHSLSTASMTHTRSQSLTTDVEKPPDKDEVDIKKPQSADQLDTKTPKRAEKKSSNVDELPSPKEVEKPVVDTKSSSTKDKKSSKLEKSPSPKEVGKPMVDTKNSSTKGIQNAHASKISNTTISNSDPSIEEVVTPAGPRRPPSHTDLAKLEADNQFLRRSLQNAKRDRWTKITVDETVRKMIHGEAYTFEMYRSRGDKLALLDKAIERFDGNAITAAVIFLKQTVKSSIFNQELVLRPIAVNHYLSYLRAHFDFSELTDILAMLGRTDEAAMFKYRQASGINDSGSKLNCLKSLHRSHFISDPTLVTDAGYVQEQISLLERQRPIEEGDAREEAKGSNELFRQVPRKASIINMPVITTLYYCSFYHYDLAENSLACPTVIKKEHQLTDRQFLWTVLSARSRLKKWKDIEILLTAKGWFGSTKMKSIIGFDKVVEVLNQTGASIDILTKYLRMVDDQDRRLLLAKKMKCHAVVIDIFVALKERGELEHYASKLTPHTIESYYARDALNNSSIKWR